MKSRYLVNQGWTAEQIEDRLDEEIARTDAKNQEIRKLREELEAEKRKRSFLVDGHGELKAELARLKAEGKEIAFCELRSLSLFVLNLLDSSETFDGLTLEHVEMLRGRATRALNTIRSEVLHKEKNVRFVCDNPLDLEEIKK